MNSSSILKTAVLLLTLALGAWACCEEPDVTTGFQFGPGASTGLLCPGSSKDAALGCGLAPNPTPLSQLDIFLNKSGSISDLEQVRLIIGVPVATVGASAPGAPVIYSVATYNPYPTDPTHSPVVVNLTANFCGWLESGEGNAYSECSIPGIDTYIVASNGNSFANWAAADAGLGVTAAKFALYYYNLDALEDLGALGLYNVIFKSNLAVGTIEIAYGCSVYGGCATDCYSTTFTQAGIATPEPATWILVTVGAFGILLGRMRIRRRETGQ
jgi:hypothetical protein